MQLLVTQFTIKMFHIDFKQFLILWSLKSQNYNIFKTLKLSCSHEVSLCGGRIYNLYVDATVVLARFTYIILVTLLSKQAVNFRTNFGHKTVKMRNI